MNKLYIAIVCVIIFSVKAYSQSGTYAKVYTTFQNSCSFSYCHGSGGGASGLDLIGTGNTEAEKMNSVYNSLYNVLPKNAFAIQKGYKLVSPGDPYSSFLFRKAHGKLKGADLVLHADEGDAMPQNGIPLEEKDAELIRQWILYGAPKNGEVVDTAIIGKFYREGGIVSATNPPAIPAGNDGFQIHLGPFFLAPKGETEFFSKYDTRMKSATEVNKVDAYMGTGYSHHFIMYRYNDNEKNVKPWGLRKDNAHVNSQLVSAHQQSEAIPLPPGTAFSWKAGSYLDLNTHYINYSTTKVLAAEVYANVYTQPVGTAKQEMQSVLIANTNIYIPNDKKEHTYRDDFMSDDAYIWNITSHTHKYGKDYDFYIVNANGELGEQLFEGSCKEGKPGCTSTNYDYQHPPKRIFYPFYPLVNKDGETRVAHVAKYLNDGSKSVGFGATSDDEMMVLLVMYLKDTTGLGKLALGTGNATKPLTNFKATIYPNPFHKNANLAFTSLKSQNYSLKLTDISGRTIISKSGQCMKGENLIPIEIQEAPIGFYLYSLVLEDGSIASGKLSKY